MNRPSRTILIIAFICGIIFSATANRLYTTGSMHDLAIEVSDDSLIIARNETIYSDITHIRLYAKCAIKHIADSFYSIKSNPYIGFQEVKMDIAPDSTLNGLTRVIISAPNLHRNFGIRYSIDNYTHYCESEISNGIGILDLKKPIYPKDAKNLLHSIVLLPLCDVFYLYSFDDRYFGLTDCHFDLPEPICLNHGNQCVTISLPNLDNSTFRLFHLNQIIIMTDDHLSWDGITYYRSRFNSYSELLDSF